jgi:hypothetical protein
MLMVAAIVVITAWACSSRAQEGYQQLEGLVLKSIGYIL